MSMISQKASEVYAELSGNEPTVAATPNILAIIMQILTQLLAAFGGGGCVVPPAKAYARIQRMGVLERMTIRDAIRQSAAPVGTWVSLRQSIQNVAVRMTQEEVSQAMTEVG